MIAVRLTLNTAAVRQHLLRIKAGLAPDKLDQIVEDAAPRILAEIVAITPKRWFGGVRAGWQIEIPEVAQRRVVNGNIIMFWLEYGTRDHGPVEAKALFIPLTAAAATAYAAGRSANLKYGVDYVLAKRVRGISPRGIVQGFLPQAGEILLQSGVQYVTELINGQS